jgi:hypothetical protein
VLGAGPAQERVEDLGLSARRLDVGPRADREVGLRPPVDAVVERGLGDHALADPRDVRGRDVEQVRRRVVRERRLVEPDGAHQVGQEPLVDRRVEGHRRGAVDHDVQAAGDLELGGREVAVHDVHAFGQHVCDPLVADPVSERVERLPSHQRLDPLAPGRAELGPHEQGDPCLGEVEQEALEHGLPEEARHARHEHVLPGEPAHDRGRSGGRAGALPRGRGFVYHMADYALSTEW